MVDVQAQWVAFDDPDWVPVELVDDAESESARAIPTFDAGGRANQATIIAALSALALLVDGLEANTTGLGLESTLQSLLTELGQKLEPGGAVAQGDPGAEAWPTRDAAEQTGLTWETISFDGSGAHTIVTVAPGQRLRLRRFLVTTASVPDAAGDPVLEVTLGGQTLRSLVLSGRFDILGDDGEDLVISASKAGQIDGSVAYSLEAV